MSEVKGGESNLGTDRLEKYGVAPKQLQTILESSLDGIVTIDEQGRILAFNHSAERMFGYTEKEILGRNVSVLMPPPYRDEHDGYLERYLRTGERRVIGVNREVKALRKDGTVFPAYLSIGEIPGERRLFTGIVRDLSEIRKANDELRRSERLSAIGQAMTGLVHEARNALARSEAALRMIARRTEDRPELAEYIARATRAQGDIHQLFEEVREYAAPLKLSLEPYSIPLLVRNAWDQLGPAREGRDARLTEIGLTAEATCEVDDFAMQRVFRNILENSLQSCQDPVEIEVEYKEIDLAGAPGVRIAVRDNGPGIADADAAHVFEAFFTTRTRGTGLGLAIVKRIVESHGGRVRVGRCGHGGAELNIELRKRRA